MDNTRIQTIASQKSETIQKMFNAIAPTYDLLNHLMSFGLDIRWRKKAIEFLIEKRDGKILDIAAGSGDVAFELARIKPKLIIATDFALNMLDVFKQKMNSRKVTTPISTVSCDASTLPFQNVSFDATIVAFGIRNFHNRLRALQEMFRVLKPNGVSVILELTKPKAPLIAKLYNVHANHLLPLLGRIISKHNTAYSYLPQSITNFPEQEEFLSLMVSAGFQNPKAHLLTFGTATIFIGRKPINE